MVGCQQQQQQEEGGGGATIFPSIRTMPFIFSRPEILSHPNMNAFTVSKKIIVAFCNDYLLCNSVSLDACRCDLLTPWDTYVRIHTYGTYGDQTTDSVPSPDR